MGTHTAQSERYSYGELSLRGVCARCAAQWRDPMLSTEIGHSLRRGGPSPVASASVSTRCPPLPPVPHLLPSRDPRPVASASSERSGLPVAALAALLPRVFSGRARTASIHARVCLVLPVSPQWSCPRADLGSRIQQSGRSLRTGSCELSGGDATLLHSTPASTENRPTSRADA